MVKPIIQTELNFPLRLLRWSLPDELRECVCGDLLEEHGERTKNEPNGNAGYWLWSQCLRTFMVFGFKTKRGFVMRILGFIIIFFVIWFVSVLTGGMQNYINIPSFIVVLGFTFGGLLATGVSQKNMWRVALSREVDNVLLNDALQAWISARHYLLASGFVGTILGIVSILANMDDPKMLGAALSVALLTALYGVFLAYGVCMPIQKNIEQKLMS
jgi:hypothetical protein